MAAEDKNYEQAKTLLKEASSIYRKVIEKHAELLPNLVGSIYSLGQLEQREKHLEDALNAYQEAYTILQNQATLNPYLQNEKADIIVRIADINITNGNMDTAQKLINEALPIRRQLTKEQADLYTKDLIHTLLIQCRIHIKNKDQQKTREVYEEVAKLASRTVSLTPYLQSRIENLKKIVSKFENQ